MADTERKFLASWTLLEVANDSQHILAFTSGGEVSPQA